jgi:MFS family permease
MSSRVGEAGEVHSADLSYRRLFGLSDFPQLAAGTLLARTGSQLWQIALILFVLQRFHSPTLAGFASFLAIAPGLIASPIAGALLDRHGRMRLILLDYGMAATLLALLAALTYFNRLTPPLLLIIMTASSLTAPLSASGTRTLFPLVVPRDLWDRANAVDSGSFAVATVVGSALAGFFVAWFGGTGAFLITAGVFVLSGVVIFGVRDPQVKAASHEPLLRSAWQSLAYVWRNPTLRGIIYTCWTSNIPFGILAVALPVLVLRDFHWGTGAVGVLWSIAGIATVIAGIFVGRINSEGRERVLMGTGFALSAAAALCIILQSPLAVLIGVAIFGFSAGPIDIGLFSIRQRRTDPRWFGRVFAVSMSINFLGVPVGSALAGPLVERSILLTLVLIAVVSLLACVVPYLTIPRTE